MLVEAKIRKLWYQFQDTCLKKQQQQHKHPLSFASLINHRNLPSNPHCLCEWCFQKQRGMIFYIYKHQNKEQEQMIILKWDNITHENLPFNNHRTTGNYWNHRTAGKLAFYLFYYSIANEIKCILNSYYRPCGRWQRYIVYEEGEVRDSSKHSPYPSWSLY